MNVLTARRGSLGWRNRSIGPRGLSSEVERAGGGDITAGEGGHQFDAGGEA